MGHARGAREGKATGMSCVCRAGNPPLADAVTFSRRVSRTTGSGFDQSIVIINTHTTPPSPPPKNTPTNITYHNTGRTSSMPSAAATAPRRRRRGTDLALATLAVASAVGLLLSLGPAVHAAPWGAHGRRASVAQRPTRRRGAFLYPRLTPSTILSTSSADSWLLRRCRGGASVPAAAVGRVASTSGLAAAGAAAAAASAASALALKMGTPSKQEAELYEMLVGLGQEHLFQDWPVAGEAEDAKHGFFRQVGQLNGSYPGGLAAYIHKARALLASAVAKENPFEGMTPSVPDGETLTYGTAEFAAAEERGLDEAAAAAFVLVAGGLGERLGYDGIKLALPVESTTGVTYLDFYASYILALQARARVRMGNPALTLPLAIMTSDDTDAQTRALLQCNNNFGMAEGQIQIVKQDKVPALQDSAARLALADAFTLDTKPHGHGDVHHLLLRSGITEQWLQAGKRWVFFMQDTNALVVNSVLPALAVSAAQGYDMNSICIPRKAGEASGAITKLTDRAGEAIIINVEYNQLDPLLRATTYPEGDTNDPATGCSPFPGNANNIVMALPSYHRVLQGQDQGVVEEFVNPKFKDASCTAFTKPTRLECMMQDFPKLLAKELGGAAKVGFTRFEKWLSFSPAKNNLEAGAKAFAATGVPPATASSAEMEFYRAHVLKLQAVVPQAQVADGAVQTFADIPLETGPRVVLTPGLAVTTAELQAKLGGGGGQLTVSGRSTLVLDGPNIRVESLDLDGTLVVKAGPKAQVTVRDAVVRNGGWQLVPSGPDAAEEERIRGFRVAKEDGVVVDLGEAQGSFVVTGNGEVQKG